MKKYLASGGLLLASLAYILSQHLGGEDDAARIVVVPKTDPATAPLGVAKTGAPFGSPTPAPTQTPRVPVSTPTATPTPAPTPKPAPVPAPSTGQYRNGSYTGSVADAYYGYVQVKAIISGGALTNVQILQYPSDRSTSRYINSQALPYLEQEAISLQSANVNTVSGASDTSAAFRESLAAALSQA